MPVISINSAPNKPTYPSDPAAPTYFPEDARQYILASNFVGSRVTCFPPPQDTDLDILVRVTNKKFVETLLRYGWQYCSDGYDVVTDWKAFKKKKTAFVSLRLDPLNVIIMHNEAEYERFMFSTQIAKRLNLLRKEDRVYLFEAIRKGYSYA